MLVYSVIRLSDFSDEQIDSLRSRISVHFSKKTTMYRKESVLGKALLTQMLKENFSLADFFVDCSENGKPYLCGKDLHFNISHCDDYVLCVCGSENVGCDIEKIKLCNEKVVRRFFAENEVKVLTLSENADVDFTRMWTLKESALKFSGEGISGGLNLWDFSGYYMADNFSLNGLSFRCREFDNSIISFCSTCDKIVEIKADINNIT